MQKSYLQTYAIFSDYDHASTTQIRKQDCPVSHKCLAYPSPITPLPFPSSRSDHISDLCANILPRPPMCLQSLWLKDCFSVLFSFFRLCLPWAETVTPQGGLLVLVASSSELILSDCASEGFWFCFVLFCFFHSGLCSATNLYMLYVDFCVNLSVHFPGINALECNGMFSFFLCVCVCHTLVSRVPVQFYIPTSNEWFSHFLHIQHVVLFLFLILFNLTGV